MNVQYHSRARGIALPVMLIILAVMLIGSLYLMKASTTSTLTSANLAYDSSLSKAADLGLHAGANWLKATALANRSKLLQDSDTDGYVATMVAGTPVSSPAFWAGSVTITDTATPANTIEYVIHRMCSLPGAYDAPGAPPNSCVQTTAAMTAGAPVAVGESLSDFEQMPDPPQIHYVVTARIFGPRGGNVVNQAIVLIGV
jgi:Tfp pilus assembly protein PilX